MSSNYIDTREKGIFNYDSVDSSTSTFLKSKELNIRTIASTMINQLGKELSEAQEKLAGSNHHDGMFEKWYTSLGFKKRTVYNYINKYEYLSRATDAQVEIIEDLPAGLAYEVTKPTADEKVNEKVFSGDVTTLKEYKKLEKEKKELEESVRAYKHQQDLLREENEILKSREPEVVEVEPVDYVHFKVTAERLQGEVQDLKEKLNNKDNSKEDFNRLRKEYENKVNESHELRKQIDNLVKEDSETAHKEKLKDSALMFSTKIHTFLNDVGGLAWLTEYLDELDDYDKRSYFKALDLLEGWVLTVKSNINKEEF